MTIQGVSGGHQGPPQNGNSKPQYSMTKDYKISTVDAEWICWALLKLYAAKMRKEATHAKLLRDLLLRFSEQVPAIGSELVLMEAHADKLSIDPLVSPQDVGKFLH